MMSSIEVDLSMMAMCRMGVCMCQVRYRWRGKLLDHTCTDLEALALPRPHSDLPAEDTPAHRPWLRRVMD